MKFSDRRIGTLRYLKPTEVEPLRARAYSKTEIDLSFEYASGKDSRRITVSLSKEEALQLSEEISEFINDPWEKE